MKKFIKNIAAALVCLVLTQTIAIASSHREAPLISNDPLADNTDVYAFRSPTDTNKVVLIANYIPFEHPAGGPNWYSFGENIRYEIHVDNNSATAGDDIIYRFTFRQVNEDPTTFFSIRLGKENSKTFYTLERSMNGGASFTTIITNGVVPPPNIGPRSIESAVGLGAPNYDTLMNRAIRTSSTGEKVFAGPIDDPFFVDLGGTFDVGNFRQPGRDGLAKFNCHSLVIEVPISTLQKAGKNTNQAANILDGDFVIGVYASASRQQIYTFDSTGGNGTHSGAWVQVSRLGMPLTNEVVIPIGQKDKFNATIPNTGNEGKFEKYFKNPELALYMDNSQFGTAVPGLSQLRIQSASLGQFDFRNGKPGLFPLKGTAAVAGTALDNAAFGNYLLPDNMSPRAVDLLPIFNTGVPNLRPYQLATGKPQGNPLAAGKPFINNFLPTFSDMLRLNMAVPVTPRRLSNGNVNPDFSSLGLVQAAVLGLTDTRFNQNASLQFIPNMDGFPNGRRLEDDVTTIELQAVGGVVLAAIGLWYDDYNVNTPNANPVTPQLVNVLSFNAGVTRNDTTLKSVFPYVQGPWRGFVGASYSGTNPLPTFLVNGTIALQPTCNATNGNITIQPTSGTAPFMYSIDGGVTYISGPNAGFTFINLGAGTYNLRLKDATGNESVIVPITLSTPNCPCVPPTFLNNGQIVLMPNCGMNNGNITIQPTSGNGPFMYSIDGGTTYVAGGNNGFTFLNLGEGTYRLRLKAFNGCESAVIERTLTCRPSPCTAPTFLNNGQIVLSATCGMNNGNITIMPTSGTAPFMYSINGGTTYVSGGNNGFTFLNLAAGSYQLRLKDAGGCESAVLTRTVGSGCPGGIVGGISNPNDPLGLSQSLSEKEVITTFPNPSKGQFKVILQNFRVSKAEVQVTNANGAIIQKQVINLGQNTMVDFDLRGKARGLYFIKVVSSTGTKVVRVLIH